MKVWHKILVTPVVAIVFLLALGVLSVAMLARQGLAVSELIKDRGGALELALGASQEISLVHSGAYRSLVVAGEIAPEKAKAATAEALARIDKVAARVKEFGARPQLTAQERRELDAVPPLLAAYRKDVEAALQAALMDPAAARARMEAADAGFQKTTATLNALLDVERQMAAHSAQQGADDFKTTVTLFIGCVLLAVAAALAIALAMGRAIVRPLNAAASAAAAIARGDLTTAIAVRGKDETAGLLAAQARMQQDLRQVAARVVSGARSVSDTSAQIAQGNQELAQRTEMQASTLEETASSMEELTSTVQQNAENARVASQLAVDASEVARRGGQVVGQVVSTMTGISESSRRIGDIIGVIDGIAFQTNILALNAAVEAARAGEQGRGFAVVAAEVRNLAQRSAAAAKEIKGLIGESVDKVDAGTKLVDAAGSTMQEIVASVKKVSDLIAEIAAASHEQSSGISQVNTAVTQMEQVVQQNAALVEEASAATESMKAQAAALLQVVSHFQVGAAREAVQRLQPREPAAPQAPIEPIRTQPLELRARPALAAAPAEGDGQWRTF
ncbi:MAG: HAMP domain-containing protein [Burkholderiales bacterium]|nr:HAMP domain-containing protein [Burkholderiales bacterium]